MSKKSIKEYLAGLWYVGVPSKGYGLLTGESPVMVEAGKPCSLNGRGGGNAIF